MWERTKFNIVFSFCISRFYNNPLLHCHDYIIAITQNKYAILIIHVYNFIIV